MKHFDTDLAVRVVRAKKQYDQEKIDAKSRQSKRNKPVRNNNKRNHSEEI